MRFIHASSKTVLWTCTLSIVLPEIHVCEPGKTLHGKHKSTK